jgi:hypothetical protein
MARLFLLSANPRILDISVTTFSSQIAAGNRRVAACNTIAAYSSRAGAM